MHFAEKHLEICREVRAGTAPLAASFLFGFSLHCEILNVNVPVVKVTRFEFVFVPDWGQERRADGPHERVRSPDGSRSELQHQQLYTV